MVGDGFWACVESVAGELFADGDDVFAQGVWHGLGCVRGARDFGAMASAPPVS